jgi:uracil-DNA glycosylase
MKNITDNLFSLKEQIESVSPNHGDLEILLQSCMTMVIERYGPKSVYLELLNSIEFPKWDKTSTYQNIQQILFTRNKEKLRDLLTLVSMDIQDNEKDLLSIHEIICLRNHLKTKVVYGNSGMTPIVPIEKGLGFFPYGSGLGVNCKTFPKGGIMVLGQDFGTIDYVHGLKGKGESQNLPTWRNIIRLLNKTGINENECFFTNAIMGARVAGESMTGQAPPFKTKKYPDGERFLKECIQFFIFQVEIQRPRLIICMGKWVLQFLKKHFKYEVLNDFDVNGNYRQIPNHIYYLKSMDMGSYKADLALIVHPSTPNRANNRTIDEEAETIKNNLVIGWSPVDIKRN